MNIKMQLLSDVIFGSGISVPGGEDISVLCDRHGFPYYKGGTFKGVFREELYRVLEWQGKGKGEIEKTVEKLLGVSGNDEDICSSKLVFSDFSISENVKRVVLEEVGETSDGTTELITELFTHQRTLTAVEGDGIVKEGSLRTLRCVNKGLYFYSEIACESEDEPLIKEVLSVIKWIGSMRNRGFGKVKITVEE